MTPVTPKKRVAFRPGDKVRILPESPEVPLEGEATSPPPEDPGRGLFNWRHVIFSW